MLSSPDPEVVRRLEAEVVEAGHQVVSPGEEVDAVILDARMDDVAGVVAPVAHLHVLLFGPVELLVEPPDGVDEIAALPLQPREIAARLALLDRRRRATTREKLLATAIDAVGEVIEIASPDAVLEYVNPAYERTFGIPRDEAIGKTPKELVRSSEHSREFFMDIDQTLRVGEVWEGVIVSRARDGRLVYCQSTISPVFDGDGVITHHVGVKRDVTARVRAEEELRRTNHALVSARDAALAANRAKSRFLANMSHELRTPLNAIIGYSEMLCEEAEELNEPALLSDLQRIRSAGRHLLGLINDVLDLSKIEVGKMELFLEELDVADTVAGVVDTVRPLFAESGNQLHVELGDGLGSMRADLTKIRQTLLNLLSNANKFTSGGAVRLAVRAGPDTVLFQVEDSGIGMTAEQLHRLFTPFTQADASTTRKYGGTGLGLTISRRFCEMMGGTIDVESVHGEGSTFRVLLPRVVLEDAAQSLGPNDAGHLVLVVDDDPTVHDLLSRSLAKRRLRVESVHRGDLALETARRIRPHVIVLDVMMPGMDGWSVLQALKSDETTADIPVIMHTILREAGKGYALGAVDYVVKPVEPSRLVKVIQGHLSGGSVLVVEDDHSSRELIVRALQGTGHQVVEAADGRAAIEHLETMTPGLLLLDLMLPHVDGFGVLEHIRTQPRLREVPVVVVTAKTLTVEERSILTSATERVLQKQTLSNRELVEAVTKRVTDALEA